MLIEFCGHETIINTICIVKHKQKIRRDGCSKQAGIFLDDCHIFQISQLKNLNDCSGKYSTH